MNVGGPWFSEVVEEVPELQCPHYSDCGCSWLSHNVERWCFNLNGQNQPPLPEALKIS